MTATDPQGRTISFNSPDGSMPTEEQLGQMFALKYGGQQTPTQTPQNRFPLKSEQPDPNSTYSYMDALKDTGKTVVNSLANVGDSIIKPFQHPIQSAGNIASGIGNIIQHPIVSAQNAINNATSTNNPDNVPNWAYGIHTDPLSFASNVVGTGALLKGAGELASGVGKAGAEVPNIVNNAVAPIRDYAGNKVNAIRAGAKDYWKAETGAYGQAIDAMGNNKSAIPSGPVLENMTGQMVDRGLYDNMQDTWAKPLNRVDVQLKKSYDVLLRKSQETGDIKVADVIREYQNIRDSVPVGSPLGKDARNIANNFIYSLNKQIDLPALKAANLRYSEFKDNFNAIDSKIDVWGNPLQTAKGENFLTGGISKTRQARVTAQSIEKNTGQSLKGAKALSTINNFPLLKLLTR